MNELTRESYFVNCWAATHSNCNTVNKCTPPRHREMQVVSANAGILCSSEVYELLREKRISRRASNLNPDLQNRDMVENTVMAYLELQPMTGKLDVASVGNFLEMIKLNDIVLTKAEIMQILNHLPSTIVEIHLVSPRHSFNIPHMRLDD
jgi:hypothetical protein